MLYRDIFVTGWKFIIFMVRNRATINSRVRTQDYLTGYRSILMWRHTASGIGEHRSSVLKKSDVQFVHNEYLCRSRNALVVELSISRVALCCVQL